ncbi:MAG: ferritin-like domain-containing protein [Deltaproteobacteria bacterium]|nr:ferritin-like domain-containing protein [Deltaproteobacteria bacterium]
MKRPPASDRVRDEWLRRVEAEYRSCAITQHLGLWLLQIGAAPDLIKGAMRIAGDELAHADLSHRAYEAAGGGEVPRIERDTLRLVRHELDPLEHDVTRVCVDVFCLGETIAVPLFHKLRAGCTVPVARRVLDRVLRDEVRHRDFGWTLLDWLVRDHPLASELRAVIERELPSWFSRLRGVYAPAGAAEKHGISAGDRAWGLMAPATYGEVLSRTLERAWIPRFGKLGFDARRAFDG